MYLSSNAVKKMTNWTAERLCKETHDLYNKDFNILTWSKLILMGITSYKKFTEKNVNCSG